MLYIIGVIIGILLLLGLFQLIGEFLLKVIKGFFSLIFGIIYLVIAGPALLLRALVFGITKILHLQSLSYFILGLTSLPSFVYLIGVHIPYSSKERTIKVKEYFKAKKKQRLNTIAMSAFLSIESYLLLYFFDYFPNYETQFLLASLFFAITSLIYTLAKCVNWRKENKEFYTHCLEWRKWTKQEVKSYTETQAQEVVVSLSDHLLSNDTNSGKFTMENLPYGRVNAFLSYFEKSIDDEDPVYFSPKMSPDENELREYGTLVTTRGVYISIKEKDIEIPFSGLWRINKCNDIIEFDYGLSYEKPRITKVGKDNSSIDLSVLVEASDEINNLSLAMYKGNIKTELYDLLDSLIDDKTREAEKKFDKKQKTNNFSKIAELSGLAAGLEQNSHIYDDEVKYYMNGARGGGYAAEYGNNAIDRITGKDVKNLAQDLDPETGRQRKGGADRQVNGELIQTKYYKSAQESIGAAFERKEAIYVKPDGSMMQIEVPRDQYNQAKEIMRDRIAKGQVPGETNPDNAGRYVRKGHFTYFQANNIALAGSIEGISADISQGIACSLPGAGITAVLTFACAVWNGQNIKEAAKMSAISSLKVMGKSALLYTITMQLSRDKIVNIFGGIEKTGDQLIKSWASVKNPIFNIAEGAAKKIADSSLAQSKLGETLQLDKMNGRKLIGGTVTAAVVYGPDIVKSVQGKISGKQLIKNSTVNTAGLIGAALGSAIPIPVVGTMLGGAVGSFIAKKIMDNFIEDDAVLMFKIFREEFLDIVMLYSFKKEEFDGIVSVTIANPKISQVLQSMYQSGLPKEYADTIIGDAVQNTLSKRQKVTSSMIEEANRLLLDDSAVA